jgi:hypothetical protein
MNPHLSSSGRKFHESRKGGEAGTERDEHPFLWPDGPAWRMAAKLVVNWFAVLVSTPCQD